MAKTNGSGEWHEARPDLVPPDDVVESLGWRGRHAVLRLVLLDHSDTLESMMPEAEMNRKDWMNDELLPRGKRPSDLVCTLMLGEVETDEEGHVTELPCVPIDQLRLTLTVPNPVPEMFRAELHRMIDDQFDRWGRAWQT